MAQHVLDLRVFLLPRPGGAAAGRAAAGREADAVQPEPLVRRVVDDSAVEEAEDVGRAEGRGVDPSLCRRRDSLERGRLLLDE